MNFLLEVFPPEDGEVAPDSRRNINVKNDKNDTDILEKPDVNPINIIENIKLKMKSVIAKKENECDDNDEVNFEKLIEIVFKEVIPNDRRKFIDFDDFSTIMWTTTIDKSCSIDFLNQY
jgi:hypothetical protein